ncbi:hypothetical protein LCL96_08855 [Rossellomorea aquimaris]|uniref:hypothetical protein n=1 Tax=Rossellomorea aquimaris TaxID=189382 RepID=UPI001CD7362C|nr:hypothetical protein [Rossellomorea aquimaris]MCA1059043.1 hypothetical protein [Rossellomorea aquimaris]
MLFRLTLIMSLLLVFGEKPAGAMPSFQVEILPWNQVKEILPKYSYFTIIDVDTGLSFNVQRRAGSKHADVQPVTEKDTEMMKTIYGGTWSWDRRAILVLVNDKLISASMNGMPHGGGALQNNFPGHFCVHFYGSTTHKTPTPDLAHKIMILKAGGKLDQFLYQSDPYELISFLEIAINQQDEKLLSRIMTGNKGQVRKALSSVKHVQITQRSILPVEDLPAFVALDFQFRVKWIKSDHSQEEKKIQFYLLRDTPEDQWKIDGQTFAGEMGF